MFGRKQKRIEALAAQIDNLKDQIDNLTRGTTRVIEEKQDLARELREMDNMVFQMANQPGWEQMRPFFQRMAEESMRRKTAESHRISSLMIPELERTYG